MANYIPGILYVLSFAVGMVLLDNVIAQINPLLSLVITSLFAIIFFHLFTKTKIKEIYQVCWAYRSEWFLLNIIVAIIWLCTYYCVKWLNPTACLFLFFLAMTSTYWARELIKIKKLNRGLINIILPILFIGIFYYFYSTDLTSKLGILAGMISGIFGSFYNSCSKSFSDHGKLTASDVLAVRFYLILFFTPFLLTPSIMSSIDFLNVAKLLLVSLFTFILPLYMNQRSIMSLTLDKHVMVVSSLPLVAYLIQGFATQQWSLLMLIMSALTLLFLIVSQYINK